MDYLEKTEKLAKIFSLLAIPLVIAMGGWLVQSTMNNKTIQRDYVKLAVEILKEKTNKDNPQLRRWAAETLALYSEIPFSNTEMKALKDGTIVLPSISYKYDAQGRLVSVKYPGGKKIKYSYDDEGRLIDTKKKTTTYKN